MFRYYGWILFVLQCQWTEIGQYKSSIYMQHRVYFAGYSRSFHNLDIKKSPQFR